VHFAGGHKKPHRLKPVPREHGALQMKLKCPICKQPVDSETTAEFPFCSERCREHDLGNWAMEKYKVAAPMMDESELEETETDERTQHGSLNNDDE
jgi:endogenous inhibitor of DNA gyrase (YacG/DUF329 family)